MDELKITGYADSVSDLPDNPSDAGYTPDELKRIFDSRTDNEVKEKHNLTVDALIALDNYVKELSSLFETHIAQLTATLENYVKQEEYTALSEKTDALETEQADLKSQLEGLVESTAQLQEAISAVDERVTGVVQRISELETNSATNEDVESLAGRVTVCEEAQLNMSEALEGKATKEELAEVANTHIVRGVDYWTEEDIAEIKSYVNDAILGGAW